MLAGPCGQAGVSVWALTLLTRDCPGARQSANTLESLSNLMLVTGSTRWLGLLNNSFALNPLLPGLCYDDHLVRARAIVVVIGVTVSIWAAARVHCRAVHGKDAMRARSGGSSAG